MSIQTRSLLPKRLDIPKSALAFRALRITKGLTRHDVARAYGATLKAFEQLENGRWTPRPDRFEKVLAAYKSTLAEYQRALDNPRRLLEKAEKERILTPKAPPGPPRNCRKIITKEVRILRILRKKAGLSQCQASLRCGYSLRIYGQIENGRIDSPRERIDHIVRSMGFKMIEFDRLLSSEVLRDELIEQCVNYLEALDDVALNSAQTVIKALLGRRA